MRRMPSIFISHGAPTLALDAEKGIEFWNWAQSLPKPKALLVISAHWETRSLALGTTETQSLIYDFHGFPDALREIVYRAPGSPELAERVQELIGTKLGGMQSYPKQGWDHGVWTPLVHMYPKADIPLLQMGLPRDATPEQLYYIGQLIEPLRNEGVLIIGSGQITHNLRAMDFSPNPPPKIWAVAMDGWCKDILMSKNWGPIFHYKMQAPHFSQNHPTDEHFRPLLLILGTAHDQRGTIRFPITGFDYGSLSRRSIQFN